MDEYLRTNVSNIFAAGGRARGWVAGGNMAGVGQLYIRNTEDDFGLLYGAPLLERVR